MALDEQPIPLTQEEAEALSALCQSVGIPEAQAFHEVMRAGLCTYHMELTVTPPSKYRGYQGTPRHQSRGFTTGSPHPGNRPLRRRTRLWTGPHS